LDTNGYDPFQFINAVVATESSFAVTSVSSVPASFPGNVFKTRRPLGDICMTSPVINIASVGPVDISINVYRSGTGGYFSVDDDVEFKYSVNGGALVSSGSLTGIAGSSSSWNPTGITGNTLQVYACLAANGITEDYDLRTFTVNKGTVLPITLSGFFANLTRSGEVNLTWQTAMEKNNAYFDIERTEDGINFKNIGQVRGKGNTSSGFVYGFMDKKPNKNFNYYRLKQVDDDGSFEYSSVIVVKNKNSQQKLAIYPNPSEGILRINAANEDSKLLIFNEIGMLVRSYDNTPNELNLSDLPTGLYFIENEGQRLKWVKM
jgi:hypothetical protein